MELKPSDEEQKDGAILNCSRVKVRKTRVRVTHEYKEIKNIKKISYSETHNSVAVGVERVQVKHLAKDPLDASFMGCC